MKITNYTVVRRNTETQLVESLKFLLEKGWQPFGNLVLDNSGNNEQSIYQAMVKYEESKASKALFLEIVGEDVPMTKQEADGACEDVGINITAYCKESINSERARLRKAINNV